LISKVLIVDSSKRLTLEQILTHPFMSATKIPKQLTTTMLSQAPNKTFLEQYTVTPHYSASKIISKNENKC
jgi:polo-like kinase 1